MCSDKTGTLTENVMVFKEVVVTIFNQNHNNDKSVHLVCLIMRTLTRLAWEGASTAKQSCSIGGLYLCAPSQTWRAGIHHTSSQLPGTTLQISEGTRGSLGERGVKNVKLLSF